MSSPESAKDIPKFIEFFQVILFFLVYFCKLESGNRDDNGKRTLTRLYRSIVHLLCCIFAYALGFKCKNFRNPVFIDTINFVFAYLYFTLQTMSINTHMGIMYV